MERSITFNDAEMRAILAGTKTQTRRVVTPRKSDGAFYLLDGWPHRSCDGEGNRVPGHEEPYTCPYGRPGDRLWVREAWSIADGNGRRLVYRADLGTDRWPTTVEPPTGRVWRPSTHMKRADARITLEVTFVRVERVQSISEEDARAEGIEESGGGWRNYIDESDPRLTATASFATLWEPVSGKREGCSWYANPWVWVVGFKRVGVV